jgi:sugar O-acyltransferase (sialic acid O-acetyltransferase NeuD family)
MNLEHIYVYGAGGHGKVVADILRAARLPVVGFLDDAADRVRDTVLGMPVFGVAEWLLKNAGKDTIGISLGIGDNYARHAVAKRCELSNFEVITVVHPSATVSSSCSLLAGTVVMPGGRVNAEAQLGFGVIVNTGAVIEHDCVIGDYAHLSPNSALGGGVRVGAFSHVGLGAVVLPGVSIGARSAIGAGAVVVHDIPDGVVALGVPARIHASVASALSVPA